MVKSSSSKKKKSVRDDDEEDASAELARLRAENAELKANTGDKPFSLKVSPKGAVSVYGMGRFPTTLYPEQWQRILGKKKTILAFIEENKSQLKFKNDDKKRSS